MHMKKNKITIILSWIAVFVWLGIIFYLSSQPATQSGKLSMRITTVVVDVVKEVSPRQNYDMVKYDHIVRKNAHFIAYLSLGLFAINAARRSKINMKIAAIITLIICVIYSMTDEFHQVFVAGRGASFKDVMIDSSGSIIGLTLYLIISTIVGYYKSKNKTSNNKFL